MAQHRQWRPEYVRLSLYVRGVSVTSEDTCVEQPKTPPSAPLRPSVAIAAKKSTTFGTRKIVGTKLAGGLGAKKLISKTNESLYDQKSSELPAEPPVATNLGTQSTPRTSRFTYAEEQSTLNLDGVASSGHILAPAAGMDYFSDFAITGNRKSGSYSRPRPQIEDSGEAQRKFANAKSISSAQFFLVRTSKWLMLIAKCDYRNLQALIPNCESKRSNEKWNIILY